MENIKKKFGFGCMRLPMRDGEVDTAEFTEMVSTILIRHMAMSMEKVKRH